MNQSGYQIEIEGSGNQLMTTARDFREVKKILRDSKIDGKDRISVVRQHDRFEIFVGDVQRARVQFGL